MSSIKIDAATQRALHSMWRDANAWLAAANGFNPLFSGPQMRNFACARAKHSLDSYFEAIDREIHKAETKATGP